MNDPTVKEVLIRMDDVTPPDDVFVPGKICSY